MVSLIPIEGEISEAHPASRIKYPNKMTRGNMVGTVFKLINIWYQINGSVDEWFKSMVY